MGQEAWLKAYRRGSSASGMPLLFKSRPFLRILSFVISIVVNKASVSVLAVELIALLTIFGLHFGVTLLKEPT